MKALRIRATLTSLALAATLAAPLSAQARDKEGNFAIKSAGVATCSKFVASYDAKDTLYPIFVGWVFGNLTAQNQYLEETFDLLAWQSPESVPAVLYGHCKKNPEQQFAVAVLQLAKGLGASRLKTAQRLVLAKHEGKQATIYDGVLKHAQNLLKKDGHYKGAPDGKFGPGTIKALKAFQKASGLPETGLPDHPTLATLFKGGREPKL